MHKIYQTMPISTIFSTTVEEDSIFYIYSIYLNTVCPSLEKLCGKLFLTLHIRVACHSELAKPVI